MAIETEGTGSIDGSSLVTLLHTIVVILAGLLALSLLVVGTVAVIAEIKGTWHWAIHLETTIRYVALFVSRLLVVLVPLFLALVVSRRVVDDA